MLDNGLPPGRWYPPGSCVAGQGEAAAELFLILTGEAEVWQESNRGCRKLLRRLRVGEFGGIGMARHQVMTVTAIEYGLERNDLAAISAG